MTNITLIPLSYKGHAVFFIIMVNTLQDPTAVEENKKHIMKQLI